MNNKYPLSLPENTVLAGQYIIKNVLGQGGFGITYMALDRKNGSRVAVKEFFPDSMATRVPGTTNVTTFSGDRGENFAYGKQCFLQEAETLAQFIGNENIVRVYNYFEEYGTAYFVMDYIEGTSLDEYVKQCGGKIGFDEAADILIPVMDALNEVHNKGIVHRDVSPDNIYITNDGKVKLIDFGAARQSLGDKSQSLDVILKHGFAPKEQYMRRGKQGPYTDIYALGATFYYVLTGRRPPDALERIDDDEIIPPSLLGVRITKDAEEAIFMALNVQPSDRFQSMVAFKNVIMKVRAGTENDKMTVPPTNSPVGPTVAVQEAPMPVSANQTESSFDHGPATNEESEGASNNTQQFDESKLNTNKNKNPIKTGLMIAGILLILAGVFIVIRVMSSENDASTITSESYEPEEPDVDLEPEEVSEKEPDQSSGETSEDSAEIPAEDTETEESEVEETTTEKNLYPEIVGNTIGNLLCNGFYENTNGLYCGDGTIKGSVYSYSYFKGKHYGLYYNEAYTASGSNGKFKFSKISELEKYDNIDRLFVSEEYYFIQLKDDSRSMHCISRKDGSEIGTRPLGNNWYTFLHGYLIYIDNQKLVKVPAGDISSEPSELVMEEASLLQTAEETTEFNNDDTWLYDDGDVINAVRYKNGAYWIANWKYQISKYNDYKIGHIVNSYHYSNCEGVVVFLRNDNEAVLLDICKEGENIREYDVFHIDLNNLSGIGYVSVSLKNVYNNNTTIYEGNRSYIEIECYISMKTGVSGVYGFSRSIGTDVYGNLGTGEGYNELGLSMN